MITGHAHLPDFFRRFVAAGSAALVFALTVFAASPVAHSQLHEHSHSHPAKTVKADDQCAVVLFANGVVASLDPIQVPAPTSQVLDFTPTTAEEIFLVSPRYLRQPERGPPALG